MAILPFSSKKRGTEARGMIAMCVVLATAAQVSAENHVFRASAAGADPKIYGANCTAPGTLSRRCATEAARAHLDLLAKLDANVVTAESLTSGMIVSTLVDVPFHGRYIYGGFSTYDSDAKRKFIAVNDPDVYTARCARQMATGALWTSRASVALSVTGKAGPVGSRADAAKEGLPFEDILEGLGVVDSATAVRVWAAGDDDGADDDDSATSPRAAPAPIRVQSADAEDTAVVSAVRLQMCVEGKGHPDTFAACEQYKTEARASPQGFVSVDTLVAVRTLIRIDTTVRALRAATSFLQERLAACDGAPDCPIVGDVPSEPYDGLYNGCGEPSSIIQERIDDGKPGPRNDDARARRSLRAEGGGGAACPDRDVAWPLPSPSATASPESGSDGDRARVPKEFLGGLASGLFISAFTVGFVVYRNRVADRQRRRGEDSLLGGVQEE